MGILGHYVSKSGLSNLSTYKYSGTDNSIIAKHMQPFWNKAVNYLPMWMAPNLVTLLGFLFIILSYLATIYYHPDITGKGPVWLYILNAICMYVYQTMDALDGKQARRTKSSSALGELFDHGCDAVTTVLGTITLACTLGTDRTILLVALVLMMSAFYFAQWEQYYTGTLALGYIGVTEAQFSAIIIYLLTAYLGAPWWEQSFIVGGWKVKYGDVPMIISAVSMIPTALSNFKGVLDRHKDKNSGVANAILKVVPVLTVSFAFLAWAWYSPIYYEHHHIYLLAYGFLVANLVGRIVLHRVCVEDFSPFQPLIFPVFAIPFVIHTPLEPTFLKGYCIVGIVGYLHFALSVIEDLCATLKIKCLRIKVNAE